MELKIIDIYRNKDYDNFTVTAQIRVPIPSALNLLPNKSEIANIYKNRYGIDHLDNGDIVFVKTFTFINTASNEVILTTLTTARNEFITGFTTFTPAPFDEYIGKVYDGLGWTYTPPTPTP